MITNKKNILFILPLFSLLFSCNPPEAPKTEEKKEPIKESSTNGTTKGQEVKDFIPGNWRIIKQVSGDLNKDNLDDVAIVIQATDKKNIIANDGGLGADSLDTNLRSLIVLFKDSIGNGYNLILKNDSFILSQEDPIMADPFSDIAIQKGSLKLDFEEWSSAGSWFTSHSTYLFRYQEGDFTLIGAENKSFMRNSGEGTDYSFNFLTKKYSTTSTNEFDEKAKPITEWKTIKLDKLPTFKTFTKPYTLKINEITL